MLDVLVLGVIGWLLLCLPLGILLGRAMRGPQRRGDRLPRTHATSTVPVPPESAQ